mmetsp:Transcript_657/g.1946  ORF Transcript_657/g.1946 Transcript_657/m.1946 type:complete len:208 (-) Transcript_657:1153-1776(-)
MHVHLVLGQPYAGRAHEQLGQLEAPGHPHHRLFLGGAARRRQRLQLLLQLRRLLLEACGGFEVLFFHLGLDIGVQREQPSLDAHAALLGLKPLIGARWVVLHRSVRPLERVVHLRDELVHQPTKPLALTHTHRLQRAHQRREQLVADAEVLQQATQLDFQFCAPVFVGHVETRGDAQQLDERKGRRDRNGAVLTLWRRHAAHAHRAV